MAKKDIVDICNDIIDDLMPRYTATVDAEDTEELGESKFFAALTLSIVQLAGEMQITEEELVGIIRSIYDKVRIEQAKELN